MFKENTKKNINNDGITTVWEYSILERPEIIQFLDTDIIWPQSEYPGGEPNPRKLNDDAIITIFDISSDASIITL